MAPSPAERVFGITELAEQILLDLTADTKIRCEPATGLFQLTRVNKSLRSIIRGSKKMRRRMWLEPLPALRCFHQPGYKSAIHGRCSWLLARLLNPLVKPKKVRKVNNNARYFGAIRIDASKTLVAPEGDPSPFLAAFLRRDASWRQMHNTGCGGVFIQLKVSPERTGDFEWVTDPKWGFREDIIVRSRTSLSHVCDKYISVFRRSQRQHYLMWKEQGKALGIRDNAGWNYHAKLVDPFARLALEEKRAGKKQKPKKRVRGAYDVEPRTMFLE